MAEEEQSQEKTEEPSAKRLKESREKGQVPRSKDFNSLVILMAATSVLLVIGPWMGQTMMSVEELIFRFNVDTLRVPDYMLTLLENISFIAIKAITPFLLFVLVITLAGPMALGGFVMSSKALAPKFSRLNPISGLKRMVSVKGFMEMLKSVLKFILIGAVSLLVLKWRVPALLSLAQLPLENAIADGLWILIQSILVICASLIVIALIDVPFQLFEHKKELRMTKQELKDEYKETEGKPEVKGQIRRAQQELARRRMVTEVPKATVVLTNPTHYAVALRYEQDGKRAPHVVAKGQDLLALHLGKLAKSHDIPVLRIPPLTRALFFACKEQEDIPRGLYVAVAQVLAYVYQLSDKKSYEAEPELLQQVPIPDEFVRNAEEASQ